MTVLLDDQGRLFGRVNLIDAAVALFILALVPMAYASWALFRTPPPVIESVTPAVIAASQSEQHVQVRGRNMRPFLRAWVGSVKATYLFESPDRAQVQLPALAPGTYDLAFYDSKQVARFPNAVTVRPVPEDKLAEVLLQVRFVTRPEVLEAVKRSQDGHSDRGSRPTTSRAVLVSYEVTDEVRGTTTGDVIQGRLSVVKGLVRVLAAQTADGWKYDGHLLKAGAPFTLTGETYLLTGDILSIAVADAVR